MVESQACVTVSWCWLGTYPSGARCMVSHFSLHYRYSMLFLCFFFGRAVRPAPRPLPTANAQPPTRARQTHTQSQSGGAKKRENASTYHHTGGARKPSAFRFFRLVTHEITYSILAVGETLALLASTDVQTRISFNAHGGPHVKPHGTRTNQL